ncbi:MAG: hypothetical protein COA79_18525 [Planctomycetota bacterium]|nr:MAG: hypothetical protein COA79_18525 [Planctomycetota bacterium]
MIKRKIVFVLIVLFVTANAYSQAINPWVASDKKYKDGTATPNLFSMEKFHQSPHFKDLGPKEFCLKFFDIFYDGRRKNWGDFKKGLSHWSHTGQEPRATEKSIEYDPIILFNVFGNGYCGIQSGMMEGVFQSRPGGTPGKPLLEARRWNLAGGFHSVCDVFYEGKWHYFDIDLGGYAGDTKKGIWSIPDVMNDPDGYHGSKTSIKSPYFFKADANGAWVSSSLKGKKAYSFKDNHMVGHEMTFTLRKGETFTRYFSQAKKGASFYTPFTKKVTKNAKGYSELVYTPNDFKNDAISIDGDEVITVVRSPYNIVSSKVEASGKVFYSIDLGLSWHSLPADGLVKDVVNRWDYLLKVKGGKLNKVTTISMLYPGSLPRVGKSATQMSIEKMADYQSLTWYADFSSAEAIAKWGTIEKLKYKSKELSGSFTKGQLSGNGSLTIPVTAPKGTKLVKLSVCVKGGQSTSARPNEFIELYIGKEGASKLIDKSVDCSSWGANGKYKVEHGAVNVNGSLAFEPADKMEIKVKVTGWGYLKGMRVFVFFKPIKASSVDGELIVTHGYDGKTFSKTIKCKDIGSTPITYSTPDGAKENDFIKMEVK